MAKTTITHITDDLDGSKDATEVAFSFNGSDYTIDLSKKNLALMEKALKPYQDAATKVSGRTASRRGKTSRSSSSRRDLAKIREWAREQGIEVSERGRVSSVVIEQYEAAQGPDRTGGIETLSPGHPTGRRGLPRAEAKASYLVRTQPDTSPGSIR